MPHTKRASKRKHPKEIVPVVGAVGVSLSLAGGASAATAPTTDTPSWAIPPQFTLTEEEISDVSLATFYVFDRESAMLGTKIAQRCGRCGGCRGCAAVARCGGRCAAVARWGCARCGCSCSGCAAPCWIWGAAWLYIC